jgi:hypothetical protein
VIWKIGLRTELFFEAGLWAFPEVHSACPVGNN